MTCIYHRSQLAATQGPSVLRTKFIINKKHFSSDENFLQQLIDNKLVEVIKQSIDWSCFLCKTLRPMLCCGLCKIPVPFLENWIKSITFFKAVQIYCHWRLMDDWVIRYNYQKTFISAFIFFNFFYKFTFKITNFFLIEYNFTTKPTRISIDYV